MKRSGRISFILLFAIAGVIILVVLAMMSGSSPSTAAAQFLTALQKKDVKTLVELSDVPDQDKPALEKKLNETVNIAGKNYNFTWRVVAQLVDGDSAAIKLQYVKNVDNPSSYEENIDLQMVKVGDKWKVSIFEIPRKLYPGLPRADFKD